MPLDLASARKHFRTADRTIFGLIQRVGPCTLKPQKQRFEMLVNSILSQQISTSAARSIRRRLTELIAPSKVRPEVIARLDATQLRTAGVSPQKAGYLLDLALKTLDKTVNLPRISRRTDEEAIAELIQVKGIGRWTAQMFLIFSLGRPDVFAPDDLGIKSAIRNLYGLSELPTKEESLAIAAPWRPHSTLACWYLWRSLEFSREPVKK